jgi:CelD/BcsL family acetyltransferase involved in cellulose biosynthesis
MRIAMPGTATEIHHEMADLAGDWEELADRTGAAPWLRPGWLAAWHTAFGTGGLHLITVRHGRRLAGVLPMQRSGPHLRSPSNYHTPAFGLLGEDAAALQALADAALTSRVRRVDLKFLPDGGASLAACLSAAERARRWTIARTIERSPIVDTTGSWEAYQRGRRGHLTRELRRRRRRLEEEGHFEFVVEDGRSGVDGLLDEGFAVEQSGWKGGRGTAIGSQPATRRFYRDVARWAAGCGWLRLGFLRLDGRAIAFDFAIEHDRVHYLLKTGYDPAFRRYAPGMLIRQEMLRRAFASPPVERYEFLGHDDPWKLEWADETANQVDLQAFARSPAGIVERAAFAWGRPALLRLRRRAGGS